MTDDTAKSVNVLDENIRRYYLEVMGIQCWQSLEPEVQQTPSQDTSSATVVNKTVADGQGKDREVISSQSGGELTGWLQLEAAIQQCKQCALQSTRKQAICGRGNKSAELMFVFLAPDMNDDASGVLCSGEANELFGKMLNAIDISINDVYITSLLKCSVPAQHTVSVKELQLCSNYLKKQIKLIQPKQLVVLGETATRCLLQKELSLDELRQAVNSAGESVHDVDRELESVPLLVSYSPQTLLRQPENKRKAWSDLQQLQKIVQSW